MTVENGLVTSLVFDRYDMTLGDMVRGQLAFDIEQCLQNIVDGVKHMHSLGLVHCDIKPENVFVDVRNRQFVVGDFDSAHAEGGVLEKKGGTVGWVPKDEDTGGVAMREIDVYSSLMMAFWLRRKREGKEGWEASTTRIVEGARRDVEITTATATTTMGTPDEGEKMDLLW